MREGSLGMGLGKKLDAGSPYNLLDRSGLCFAPTLKLSPKVFGYSA